MNGVSWGEFSQTIFFKVFVGKHDLEGWLSGAREEQFYSTWKKRLRWRIIDIDHREHNTSECPQTKVWVWRSTSGNERRSLLVQSSLPVSPRLLLSGIIHNLLSWRIIGSIFSPCIKIKQVEVWGKWAYRKVFHKVCAFPAGKKKKQNSGWISSNSKKKKKKHFLGWSADGFYLFSFLLIYVPLYFTEDLRWLSKNTEDKELKR